MTSSELRAAVGYIRMSTDKQEDSPARQRAEIEELAAQNGFEIMSWYEDHGLSGTESKNRPEFQQLLRDAQIGMFEAVLMYEQSRMSREDIFSQMEHLKVFVNAGIELHTCQRGQIRLGDLGGMITAIVEADASHGESRKLSQRSTSGTRQKFLAGQRVSGGAFGYDRIYTDDTGKETRVHFRERFSKPKSWKMKLAPTTDLEALEAVKMMFREVASGRSFSSIAGKLNRQGVTTTRGLQFKGSSVREIVTRETYLGVDRIGISANGKFSSVSDGIIRRENAHPAIVTPEQFEAAQRAIEKRQATPGMTRYLYLLSKMVVCDHCGGPMVGKCTAHRNKINHSYHYWCKGKSRPGRGAKTCFGPMVGASFLESVVLEAVRQVITLPVNFSVLVEAVDRRDDRLSGPATQESNELEVVEAKIRKAKESLALASRQQDFDRIAEMIDLYEAKAAELSRVITRRGKRRGETNARPALLRSAESFSKGFTELPFIELRGIVEHLVSEVRIKAHKVSKRRHYSISGRIEFQPSTEMPPIDFTSAVPQWFKFQEMAVWVSERSRPVTRGEIMKRFQIDKRVFSKRMAMAIRDGLIKQVGKVTYVKGPKFDVLSPKSFSDEVKLKHSEAVAK